MALSRPTKLSGMGRATLATVAAALALAAPAAGATWPPPPTTAQPLHTFKIEHTSSVPTRACMAREQRAKIARWLAPVACEQPPRSELLIVTALFGD